MTVCAAILVMMVAVTVNAGLEQGIVAAWPSYRANPWAIATLYDAYSGFTIFWLWVAYRQRGWGLRVFWFIAIMALGNIATSGYLLWQLYNLKPGEPFEKALYRRMAS